jgi:hypothetical protein
VQTLVLTDIASGWTECAPLLVREQHLMIEVLGELRKLLPFPLLGFDADNDSVFIVTAQVVGLEEAVGTADSTSETRRSVVVQNESLASCGRGAVNLAKR